MFRAIAKLVSGENKGDLFFRCISSNDSTEPIGQGFFFKALFLLSAAASK
jgi:hypothetical protein